MFIKEAELSWKTGEPFSRFYKDLYFSKSHAEEESDYVYIGGNNLINRWKNLEPKSVFNIGELGFGAGINFLTTLKRWKEFSNQENWLNYYSIEGHPLSLQDLKKVHSKYPLLDSFSISLIEHYPINCKGLQRIEFIEERASLTLSFYDVRESFLNLDLETKYFDAWYLDGFSPDRNPEMWSKSTLKQVTKLSRNGTTFATFSSSRNVKKEIENNGFQSETVSGFRNKRYMLKGKYKEKKEKRRKRSKQVIGIIGAGLAGCSLARILSSKGHEVTVFEKLSKSQKLKLGHQALVLYPRLSAFNSPYSQFCLQSYLYSINFYEEIGEPYWNNTGVLILDFNEETHKRHQSLLSTRNDKKIFVPVSPKEASDIAGIQLNKPGLFFPKAGWIDQIGVCDTILEDKNINLIQAEEIKKIRKGTKFEIFSQNNKYEFDQICLCNSFEADRFFDLPGLKTKRGQTTEIKNNGILNKLKLPVCAKGYISPTRSEITLLGSTYNDKKDRKLLMEDHIENIEKARIISEIDTNISGGQVGFRATTSDRLPMVGQVGEFYVHTGHGSRGSTSIPICSHFISDLICNNLPLIGLRVINALRPERFKNPN
ncbi:MAG: FAD-dependent 5-carboxymethylaminomethyl-2-thiouridine(34) oxidoreductase MnmC [Pseudomonadota bacterium]|nr:FAD-dependent 5-carboxymethylaminomethyl-2-thiouridine(34) oxidoreductase MnmC [Pseudomonadota bacterium]